LDDAMLKTFVEKIMIDNGYAKIFCSVFMIKNSSKQNQAFLARREYLLPQLQKAENAYRRNGNGELTNFYHGMYGWMKNLKEKNLRKLELLSCSALESFRLAPVAAMCLNKKSKHYDRELGLLEINIDSCIIERPQVRKYWEKILADDFWNMSYENKRFYYFAEWKDNHPYVKRFIESAKGENIEFTKEAPSCFSFDDSSEHFEIRIADITANLFFRFINYGTNKDLIDKLKKTNFLPGQTITICDFSSDTSHEKPPNPFEIGILP